MDYEEYKEMYKFLDIKCRARDRYLESLMLRQFKADAELNKGDPFIAQLYKDTVEKEQMAEVKRDRFNGNLIFLTVSPKPSVDFSQFLKKTKKCFEKEWIKRYVYVLEQTAEEESEIGKHPHLHAIIYRDGYKFHQAVNEIKNTFKDVCTPLMDFQNKKKEITNGPFCILVRPHTVENNDRIKNYLLGWKDPKEKHEKQIIDKIWREQNNILPYYSKGIDEKALLTTEI